MPAKLPPPVGTLAFLAECGRTVYIVCNRCNRFVVASLQDIAQHVGWRANAQEAGKRLRCNDLTVEYRSEVLGETLLVL